MALLNTQPVDYPSFKLVLVGDGGTGKTTYVKRHITGGVREAIRTNNRGGGAPSGLHHEPRQAEVLLLDTAGQEKFGGLRDGYYMNGQCAIIMFDVTSSSPTRMFPPGTGTSAGGCEEWAGEGQVGDLPQEEEPPEYYEISAKSTYNFEKPFLYLARKIAGNMDLEFVEEIALIPADVTIDVAACSKRFTKRSNMLQRFPCRMRTMITWIEVQEDEDGQMGGMTQHGTSSFRHDAKEHD
ncbi:unnamed protein product [Miscanthus lutarioriparius]|uniref:GTP-binding nuclear protein n=1 Tax=Miscanthus lutarioriparius TaxID=422564 RepID=A0A811SE33_9POAL|nr:unnamed protein product [Miscanthus lutarioriparius]